MGSHGHRIWLFLERIGTALTASGKPSQHFTAAQREGRGFLKLSSRRKMCGRLHAFCLGVRSVSDFFMTAVLLMSPR